MAPQKTSNRKRKGLKSKKLRGKGKLDAVQKKLVIDIFQKYINERKVATLQNITDKHKNDINLQNMVNNQINRGYSMEEVMSQIYQYAKSRVHGEKKKDTYRY